MLQRQFFVHCVEARPEASIDDNETVSMCWLSPTVRAADRNATQTCSARYSAAPFATDGDT